MSERLLRWVNGHVLALLLAVLVVRGVFLFVNGLDLLGDESYYWDWSRQPDWCYFSKPPMVAWLIGAFTWLLGDYTAVVRLPTLVLGTVFLGYFYATAKAFYNDRAAALALLLVLATPFNVVANFLMTIDPPLYCFWMMSLYYLRRAVFDGRQQAWVWAGVAGAAALLSKQVAIAMPLMLLIFLSMDSARRHYLRREFWLYLLPMVLAALPLLWWNQQHEWVMFGHVKGHFGSHETATIASRWRDARDFLLYQVLLASPLIFLLVMIVSGKAVVGFKRQSPEQRFLLLMGPVLLIGILLLSFMQKVQGNWPIPFYFSGLILLAGLCVEGAWRKTVNAALLLGYVMVVMTYVLPLLLHAFNLQDTDLDPTKRFKQWQALAENIHIERQISLPDLQGSFVVALGHRFLASELAFYLPDHPKVFRFEQSGEVTSQYEVWPGPVEFLGKNAFVVSDNVDHIPRALQDAFESFHYLAEFGDPQHKNAHYYLFLAEHLKAWPLPAH